MTLFRNPSRDEECLNLKPLAPTADWSDITRQPGPNKMFANVHKDSTRLVNRLKHMISIDVPLSFTFPHYT